MELEELRRRYTPEQLRLVDHYFAILAKTRKSGRVAPGVLKKEMEYWARFQPGIVAEALQINIKKYPQKKEAYTRGIMRELDRERSVGARDGNGPKRGGYGKGRYRRNYLDPDKLPF